MIFRLTHQMIGDGSKTETSRLKQPGDFCQIAANKNIGVFKANGRPRWIIGRTYAVQPGRGKRAICRIRIVCIRDASDRQLISEADARAEGFKSAADFRESWFKLHGARADSPCWIIQFVVVANSAPALYPDNSDNSLIPPPRHNKKSRRLCPT